MAIVGKIELTIDSAGIQKIIDTLKDGVESGKVDKKYAEVIGGIVANSLDVKLVPDDKQTKGSCG